jgi:hypothetical protein
MGKIDLNNVKNMIMMKLVWMLLSIAQLTCDLHHHGHIVHLL